MVKKVGPQGVDILNPSTRAFRDTNLSILNNTVTAVTLPSESHDDEGWHSLVGNTERITITRAGVYVVGGQIEYAANATGLRYCIIYKNGIAGVALASPAIIATSGSLTTIVDANAPVVLMDAGDYFNLGAFQNSGGPLNVTSAFLAAFRLSRL
jgi:hypothetical protein